MNAQLANQSYFPAAVAIARAHEAQRKASRDVTCTCLEYPFPHRSGGGCCRGEEIGERTEADLNAERLALFDNEEARAINRGNSSGAW